MNKIRILRTHTVNPWFNLAIENWILRDLDPQVTTLYLWRNDKTVVIGQYQNPWVECEVKKMERDGVFLARRQSGGGAVYHDLGNTNFTFLTHKDSYQQESNYKIIVKALSEFGVQACLSGRNDLLVGDRKVSGSAFRHTGKRSFHHGTLLINADMKKLTEYLSPDVQKLQSKGIQSVRSRVANLSEFNASINHEEMCQAIIGAFCGYYQQNCEVEWLDEVVLRQNNELQAYYDHYHDWEWRFGRTPEFSHRLKTRFSWGIIDLHLNVKHAKIEETKLFSDALQVELMEQLEIILLGVEYAVSAIEKLEQEISSVKINFSEQKLEFLHWVRSQI